MTNEVLEKCLSVTKPEDWESVDGKPWPSPEAVEEIVRLFGLTFSVESREDSEAGGVYSCTIIGWCGESLFNKSEGSGTASGVEVEDVASIARRSFRVNALKRFLGLSEVTWEEFLEELN